MDNLEENEQQIILSKKFYMPQKLNDAVEHVKIGILESSTYYLIAYATYILFIRF